MDELKPRIYVSSKRNHSQLWLTYRNKHGYNIISSWINIDGVIEVKDLGQTYWPDWIAEAAGVGFLIFYSAPGDTLHYGSLLEAGACLAMGGTVLQVGVADVTKTGNGEMADFTYHPRWFRCTTLDEAFKIAALEAPLPEK